MIVYPWLGCGECEFCTSGRDNMCPAPRQIGVHRPGGYAEKIIVPDAKFLVDADGIDPVLAGLYACSGLTAYSALRKLGPIQDEWIAIIGLGGVGLMALAVAKGTGFEKVVAIDIDDEKLKRASDDYGADRVFNATHGDVVEAITSELGRLAGVVDFVGSSESVLPGRRAAEGGRRLRVGRPLRRRAAFPAARSGGAAAAVPRLLHRHPGRARGTDRVRAAGADQADSRASRSRSRTSTTA